MPKLRVPTVSALILFFFSVQPMLAAAAKTVELSPECDNYCAFSEFGKHCQGVRFKFTEDSNGVSSSYYLYSVYNRLLDKCVASKRIPMPHIADLAEVEGICKCGPAGNAPPKMGTPLTDATKAKLILLRDQIRAWAPCAPDPLSHDPGSLLQPFRPDEVKSCREMKANGQKGYLIPGGCTDSYLPACTYYGNTNNLSGVFCFAGDLERCDEVKSGQDPKTGAWYRNAYQRLYPDSEQGQPLFSRDEFMGVMFYLLKTKDRDAALKYLRFLSENPKKPFSFGKGLIKVFDICPQRPKEKPPGVPDSAWTEMLSDDRCEMRPSTWGMMAIVYEGIGISLTEIRAISPEIAKKLKRNRKFATLGARILSGVAPPVGGAAYESALQAGANWIPKILGMGSANLLKAQKNIDRRTGFISPYFHFLGQNEVPDEYGAYLIQKYCPKDQPYSGPLPGGHFALPAASFFDMGMRSFGGVNEYGIKSEPMGHECIAWINLYLGEYLK
jgi:hypothetical protein